MQRSAWAQVYPSRPVRIVVGFPAGGTSDIVARVLGQWLSERLGQQFVIENRPGAGSNLATEAVARAAPDGYTLLLIGGANTINATLFDKLNFEFLRDIAPVRASSRRLCRGGQSVGARAQAYPARPVRIIAPTGPGGAPDITARLIGPWLSDRLGHVVREPGDPTSDQAQQTALVRIGKVRSRSR